MGGSDLNLALCTNLNDVAARREGNDTGEVSQLSHIHLLDECAQQALLEHNARVYIASRSPEEAEQVVAELKSATGKRSLHFLSLDLSSFASIRTAAEDFCR